MQLLALFKFLFADTPLISCVLLRTAELGRTQSVYCVDKSAQLAGTAAQLPQQHTTAGQNPDRFHPERRRDLFQCVNVVMICCRFPTELSATAIKHGLACVCVCMCVCARNADNVIPTGCDCADGPPRLHDHKSCDQHKRSGSLHP